MRSSPCSSMSLEPIVYFTLQHISLQTSHISSSQACGFGQHRASRSQAKHLNPGLYSPDCQLTLPDLIPLPFLGAPAKTGAASSPDLPDCSFQSLGLAAPDPAWVLNAPPLSLQAPALPRAPQQDWGLLRLFPQHTHSDRGPLCE